MREDMPDIDDLPSVLDHRNQPVLVAADVEHSEGIHGIGVRKVGADIGQMSPSGSLGYAMAVQQRLQRVLVRLRELVDRRVANDSHYLKVTKTVTSAQGQTSASSTNAALWIRTLAPISIPNRIGAADAACPTSGGRRSAQ